MVGRERDDIEHQHIDALLPSAGRIFFSTHVFPLLRLHGRAEELYIPLMSSDGPEIPVMINGVGRTVDGEARYDLVLMPMRERNRLLEFAALVGERRGLQPLVVAVEEIIARVEPILAMRAAEDGHAIERTPRRAPGSVLADATAAQQIILNLGVNAIKFSPRGTKIVLAVASQAGRVRVSIADQGPGIEPDLLEQIFEPFVQLPRSEASGRRGVGLGLSISRDLARAMGGEILVDSTPGEGSTFTLELPAA